MSPSEQIGLATPGPTNPIAFLFQFFSFWSFIRFCIQMNLNFVKEKKTSKKRMKELVMIIVMFPICLKINLENLEWWATNFGGVKNFLKTKSRFKSDRKRIEESLWPAKKLCSTSLSCVYVLICLSVLVERLLIGRFERNTKRMKFHLLPTTKNFTKLFTKSLEGLKLYRVRINDFPLWVQFAIIFFIWCLVWLWVEHCWFSQLFKKRPQSNVAWPPLV